MYSRFIVFLFFFFPIIAKSQEAKFTILTNQPQAFDAYEKALAKKLTTKAQLLWDYSYYTLDSMGRIPDGKHTKKTFYTYDKDSNIIKRLRIMTDRGVWLDSSLYDSNHKLIYRVNGHYDSVKNILSLNDYFRLTYDAKRSLLTRDFAWVHGVSDTDRWYRTESFFAKNGLDSLDINSEYGVDHGQGITGTRDTFSRIIHYYDAKKLDTLDVTETYDSAKKVWNFYGNKNFYYDALGSDTMNMETGVKNTTTYNGNKIEKSSRIMFFNPGDNDTFLRMYYYNAKGLLYTDTNYYKYHNNPNKYYNGTVWMYNATGKITNTYGYQYNNNLNAWERIPFQNTTYLYNANDDLDTSILSYSDDWMAYNRYITTVYHYKTVVVISGTEKNVPQPTDFRLWPNPALASLSLEADFANGTNQKINVSIYNLHGIEVFHKDYKPSPHFYKTIAIESLPKGLYFISIAQGGSARQKSFFKN